MGMELTIRDIAQDEHEALGQLMVSVYANLEGFASPEEQPAYYEMLANIGRFTSRPGCRVLVATSAHNELVGGVVYFSDMAEYRSGGIAPSLQEASGIRLLAVNSRFRNSGAGKALTRACIALAEKAGHEQVILHTTEAMRVAWGLYERMGFQRWKALDFMQQTIAVYGFRLVLTSAHADSA